MLGPDWVVYRHRKNLKMVSACKGADWDDWVDYVFRHVMTPAYELIARGLTETQAHQMAALATKGDEDDR